MREDILAAIDAEIAKLQQARALLAGAAALERRGPGRPKKAATTATRKPSKKRKLSAEAREKIRQAQLKRWSAAKKNAK